MEPRPPFISRIIIKNYKSIARCDVHLGALQFLVGRNGSGKSNFLDALAFVRDALIFNNVSNAIGRRTHLLHHSEVERQQALVFGMRMEFDLPNGMSGNFAFEISEKRIGDHFRTYKVVREECLVIVDDSRVSYKTRDGKIQDENPERFPPVADDRLYLQSMSAVGGFHHLYESLLSMRFYSIEPTLVALMHDSQPAKMNVDADTISALKSLTPEVKDRIIEYLQHIVPSVSGFEVRKMEDIHLLFFDMSTEKPGNSWHLMGQSMSDGTLRALGILTALLQNRNNGGSNLPSLVCIEEPETGLHAHAFGALLGAMQEASDMRQVIVTTHSADMLDDKDVAPDQILPVEMRGGNTLIAPMRDIEKGMLRDHLTTAGELLRQDMLPPDVEFFADESLSLFSDK